MSIATTKIRVGNSDSWYPAHEFCSEHFGKGGVQKDRRCGGLKNGLTGHNKKIASSGGKAFAKRLSVDSGLREEFINRGKEIAKVKKTM